MILGLDLGTNSIGWSLIRTNDDGDPCGIERSGVRCFDAGVDGNLEYGKDEPRNQKRREARQMRARFTWAVAGIVVLAALLGASTIHQLRGTRTVVKEYHYTETRGAVRKSKF